MTDMPTDPILLRLLKITAFVVKLSDRVIELEAALQDAIDFVDKYADLIEDEDGGMIPNDAAHLRQYLEDTLADEVRS